MKKTLLTLLLGASLSLGTTDQMKAQTPDINCYFYNIDQDDFKEEVWGYREEGKDEKTNKYETNKMGISIIYYSDKDNDNFHEHIRIFNCDKARRIIIEDFYIEKTTGLLDYSFKKYYLRQSVQVKTGRKKYFYTQDDWNRLYSGKSFLSYVEGNIHEKLMLQEKKFYANLKIQNMYEKFGDDFVERVKKLINASESEYSLKNMLRQERSRWKNTP